MVEIRDLETRSFDTPALSVYLTLGGEEEGPERFLGPVLHGLSDAGAEEGERRLAAALTEEVEAVERELAGRQGSGAVAVFSCRPAGVLEVFELPEAVPPMIVFDRQLEMWPLRGQLERHPGEVVRRPAKG